MKWKLGISALAVAGLAVGIAGPAGAGGFVLPLTCNGTTYMVVSNGNGDFTPARDTNSNLVFHPTSFGAFTGTFTPSDGSEPQVETDPPMTLPAQPQAHNGMTSFTGCTYTLH